MAIKLWGGLGLVALGSIGLLAWLADGRLPAATLPELPQWRDLPGSTSSEVHKCRAANGQLLYSTQPCPQGTQAQPLKGQVNVLPATPVPKPAASNPLRQLNDPAEAAALRDQRMERVIQP